MHVKLKISNFIYIILYNITEIFSPCSGPLRKIASKSQNQGGQRTWNFWKPGKVKEFCATWKKSGKCQGISRNLQKSGNFNAKLGKVREFYLRKTNIAEAFSWRKIHSSGEQELVMPVHISHMLMDFCLRIT